MNPTLTVLAATLVAAFLPPSLAYADPLDPAPGWTTQNSEGERYVVLDGAGGVHVVERMPSHSNVLLRYGKDGHWSRAAEFGGPGLLATGNGRYAVLAENFVSQDGGVVFHEFWARLFSDGQWGSPTVVGEFEDDTQNSRLWLDTNSRGDAVMAWSFHAGGPVFAATLSRGGSWQGSPPTPLRLGHRFRLANPVISEAGKVSLVWFAPGSSGSGEVMRSVLPAGATQWSPAKPVSSLTITDPATLDLDTDGQGRETVAAGSRVWRQVRTGSGFRYQFQAIGSRSVDVVSSGPRTRLVWMLRSGRQYTVKTRIITDTLRPTKTVWTKTFPSSVPTSCLLAHGANAGIAPQGRSYLVWGISSNVRRNSVCPASVTRAAAINAADRVVGSRVLGRGPGRPKFQISVTGEGPVAVSYCAHCFGTPVGDTWVTKFLSR